jgi:hypothetical protein
MPEPRNLKGFPMGTLAMTSGVAELVESNAMFEHFVLGSLTRHLKGDWGDISTDDARSNDQALKNGERLFSAYDHSPVIRHNLHIIWIITEANRAITTIAFPDEY